MRSISRKYFSFRSLLLAASVLVAVSFSLYAMVVLYARFAALQPNNDFSDFGFLVSFATGMFFSGLFLYRQLDADVKESFREGMTFRRKHVRLGLLASCAAIFLFAIFSYAMNSIFKFSDLDAISLRLISVFLQSGGWWSWVGLICILLIVLLVEPILKEFFLRFFLFELLKERIGSVIAVLAVAALSGLVFMSPFHALLSVVSSVLYISSRSILSSFALHCGIAVVVYCLIYIK